MKKIIGFFAIFLALLGLASCSVHQGHYYTMSKFEYKIDEDITDIEKGIIEGLIIVARESCERLEFGFRDDDTCLVGNYVGTYTETGKEVNIDCFGTNYKLIKKGNSLRIEYEAENYSYTATYKVDKSLNVPKIR